MSEAYRVQYRCTLLCLEDYLVSLSENMRTHRLLSHPRSRSALQRCFFSSNINAANLTIQRTTASKLADLPPKEELGFGNYMSDHMLMIEWDKDNQWHDPKIVPYGNLSLSPAASCLHYGESRRLPK